jgi:AraC-like DNA-binding protein
MPDSVTSAFSEPEDFEAALRKEGCLSLLITGRGQFCAQLTQVTLHRLRLSAAEEQLARIAFIAVPTDMLIAAFPIGDGIAPVSGGISVHPGEIIILPPGEHVHMRTDGPSRWGAVWFPVEELQRYGGAVTGASFVVPSAMQVWRPPRAAGRDLRSLHTAGIRMAVTHPQCLVGAEAARGLEQQLIHAVVDCLAIGSTNEVTRSQRRHKDIMVRFERLLQTQPDQDMRLLEICTALGVSERLLRSLCAEHLGMGPIVYDRLRRMKLVRHALRRGGSAEASVSAVARRYGFRSPGRFAVNYRHAFGESPSATLRRGSDRSIVG